MASYRPFPPPPLPSFPPPPQPPNQNPSQQPPPPPPSQQPQRPNIYSQNWRGYSNNGGGAQQLYHQQYSYAPPPPPPPPESSYPPPPPPSSPPPPPPPQQQQQTQPPIYYSSNRYDQNSIYTPMQPPPPPHPPPSSSIPPSPPPPLKDAEGREIGLSDHDKRVSKVVSRGDHRHSKQQTPPVPPSGEKKANGGTGRVETEEERLMRKKREYEKQRQEKKHRQKMKESQKVVVQKSQMVASGKAGHGSTAGSKKGDKKAIPETRLNKPTTFLCKLKFRNELPDPSAQPKLMTIKKDKDRFTRYTITSLEKNFKPQLYCEPDLGIPLDLLDMSVYNHPNVRPPLDPEDEELLRDDDDVVTPVKKDGIRRKERPTDEGVSWLVKTQYISPLSMESTRQSLTEKQAKELREMKGGGNLLENLNDRERQIKEIEASFEACKLAPTHATNKNLKPVEIMPLLPDFERYDDQFVVASFDGSPTVDSEIYSKLDKSVRDAHESRALMKSYVATGSDPANPEKFLAYMVPSVNELSKDMHDEDEDISFSWVREYNWDVRGDDAEDPTSYLVSFDDNEARYVPLPTKLNLKKKRAIASDEVEHCPITSSVTVRQRANVAAIELKEQGGTASSSKMGRLDSEEGPDRSHKGSRHEDRYQSSEAEDDDL